MIDRCKPEDAAKFTCLAKNSGGEASSNGVLKVAERKKSDKPDAMPMILTPLRDLAVKEGESFSFETRVSGNPLPEVKWTLDGQPVQSSDNVSITFDGKRYVYFFTPKSLEFFFLLFSFRNFIPILSFLLLLVLL